MGTKGKQIVFLLFCFLGWIGLNINIGMGGEQLMIKVKLLIGNESTGFFEVVDQTDAGRVHMWVVCMLLNWSEAHKTDIRSA